MKLFLVVLGGRSRGCHIEQHDVRWVVGKTIDDTLPELIRQWGGLRRGLHLDSYRVVSWVDGHQVSVHPGPAMAGSGVKPRLWFVNLGAYRADSMAEQHQFGLVVAHSAAAAKAAARRRWLKGLEQLHKDDLHCVEQDPALDDLLPISGNGQWHVRLTPAEGDPNHDDAAVDAPDWYGYRPI